MKQTEGQTNLNDRDLTNLVCRVSSLSDILPLRAQELRSGKPMDSARFKEDKDKSTLHFGAFIGRNVVSCLTLIRCSGSTPASYQLRGMATLQPLQNSGYGRKLLKAAEEHLKTKHLKARIWCNARTQAVPFYHQLGYRKTSDVFDISGIGPHFKMEKIIL